MKVTSYGHVWEQILRRAGQKGEELVPMADELTLKRVRGRMQSFCKAVEREGRNRHGILYDYAVKARIGQRRGFLKVSMPEAGLDAQVENNLQMLEKEVEEFMLSQDISDLGD